MSYTSKRKKIYSLLPVFSALVPLVAAAQGPQGSVFDNIIRMVVQTLNYIIGFLFVLATVVFLWGVVMFIAKSGDEAARGKAKGIMTWGIIGLAIMAAAWGITLLLTTYFGIPSTSAPWVPYPGRVGNPSF